MKLAGNRYTICIFYRDGRDATTAVITAPNYYRPADVIADALRQLNIPQQLVSHTAALQQFMFTDKTTNK